MTTLFWNLTLGILFFTVLLPWIFFVVAPMFLVFFTGGATIYKVAEVIDSSGNGTPKKMKVLVVDDDQASVLPLLNILSKYFGRVDFVESGHDMIRNLERKPYDLIFLDNLMPQLTGVEALKLSEERVVTRDRVPVIFFTNHRRGVTPPQTQKFIVRGMWEKTQPYQKLENRIRQLANKFIRAA